MADYDPLLADVLYRCVLVALATVGCATFAGAYDGEITAVAPSRDDVTVTYLGNEAVIVAHGSTRVLVDALYFNWAGRVSRRAGRAEAADLHRRAPVEDIIAMLS